MPLGNSKAPVKFIVKKVWHGLMVVERYLGVAGMIVMTFSVFINVIMRYGFQSTIRGAEELARFTMVWVVFIGSAIGIRRNNHLTTSITDIIFKTEKSRLLLDFIRNFIMVVFSALFLSYSYSFLHDSIKFAVHSQDLEIPMWMPQSAFFVGAALFLLEFLVNFVESVINLLETVPKKLGTK